LGSSAIFGDGSLKNESLIGWDSATKLSRGVPIAGG